MSIEVYTYMPTPFSFGGQGIYISTEINEYERVDIGKGYFGILFKNPDKKIWHIALEGCGALIGTMDSKKKLLERTKKDVETGDEKTMKQQMEMGTKQMAQARSISNEEWFSKFKGKGKK